MANAHHIKSDRKTNKTNNSVLMQILKANLLQTYPWPMKTHDYKYGESPHVIMLKEKQANQS